MENNPNIIDSLFVPCNCITYSSYIGDLIRENRKIFLHKGALAKFKGYALSQIHKMKYKNPEGKRKELINKFGYDIKYGYNCIRLLDEVEQILTEHDLCLNKNIEKLKSIRNGEWSIEQIEKYIKQKECELELLFIKSDLRQLPDERHIRQLLIDCLEIWFEKEPGPIDKFIIELQGLINKYKLEEN